MSKFIPALVFGFFFLVMATGCTGNKNRKIVDVSNIDYHLQLQRFEQDFIALPTDTAKMQAGLAKLAEKYPYFLNLYTDRIMQFGGINNDPAKIKQNISMFLRDSMVQKLHIEVRNEFKNIEPQRRALEDALKHYKYYFPKKTVPKIVTFISYFGWVGITYDTTVAGIGLDMHMGKDFPYPPNVPEYVRVTLTKDYLVAHTMRVIGTMSFNFDAKEESNLLDAMIAKGKQDYFLELMLPEAPDYIIADYTPEAADWCVKNEPEIWKFFVEKELLYSTNSNENEKFVTPGPITSGMPPEAPGNIGSWVGWQIVRAFMTQHPETTFQQLLKLDANKILEGSKYKPKHGML